MGRARALYTNMDCLVRSLPPMRPAIFLPFHTLPGSWQAPVAPGLRCALLLPCDAPCPAKPQRFIVPWNPLPMLVPACRCACSAVSISAACGCLASHPDWQTLSA